MMYYIAMVDDAAAAPFWHGSFFAQCSEDYPQSAHPVKMNTSEGRRSGSW